MIQKKKNNFARIFFFFCDSTSSPNSKGNEVEVEVEVEELNSEECSSTPTVVVEEGSVDDFKA